MQDNISYEILYKPERLLTKPESITSLEDWIRSIKLFIEKQKELGDNTYLLVYCSQQRKFMETNFNGVIIIGDKEYENCNPACIYFLKDDFESENELKRLSAQIKTIDINCKIETPEWINNDIIYDGAYVAEKCNDSYIFSKADDLNILNFWCF